MTDRPPLARAATELLAAERPVIEEPSPEARARAIAAIGLEIAASARRRRLLQVGFAAAAAAAVVIAVIAARPRRNAAAKASEAQASVVVHGGAGVTIAHGSESSPAHDGLELQGGDHLLTDVGAKASLTLTSGTVLHLEGKTDVAVLSKEGDHIFALATGATTFHVAKVVPGARFVVRTSDAEIEVRGTVFRVEVSSTICEGTTTRVTVSEGAVAVRRGGAEWRVGVDERWPGSCFSGVPAPSAVATAKVAVSVPAPFASVTAPASDLAAQNDLFAEASARKRKGDRAGALAAFERLLARWPNGALAESASIERFRLLEGEPAKSAARVYLARWPNGSAQSEARAILAR